MMEADLAAMANSVNTQADFLRFVKALWANWNTAEESSKERGTGSWENATIGGFLSAMIRWMEDTDHSHRYEAPPDWNLFALALLAGSRYE